MKNLIAITVLIAAANSANAAGFQPWANRNIESTPDQVQSQVQTGAFYRAEPQVPEEPDAKQANIVVKPWYANGRV